jgi:hypothetical protein
VELRIFERVSKLNSLSPTNSSCFESNKQLISDTNRSRQIANHNQKAASFDARGFSLFS